MVAPQAHRARIVLHDASRADPVRDIGVIGEPAWIDRAKVLKFDERSSVLIGELDGRPVVVKSLKLDRVKDALSRAMGTTRGIRQWRGAERLLALGLATPKPLLLWRGRDESGAVVESIAMEAVEGKTLIQHLADRDLGAAAQAEVARLLARDMAALIRARLYNRDHKLSNLMLQRNGDACVVSIVDTVAIRPASPVEARRSMLFSLIVEAIGCGLQPPARMMIGVQRELAERLGLSLADSRGDRRAIAERLVHHGDPTPRVNPIRV